MIRFLQTKGRVQQILLIGFLSIIIIMMVVTLVPGGMLGDYFGGLNENVLAKVGSNEITVKDVQQQARDMARQQYPRGFPPQLLAFLIPQAMERMVTQNVALAEASRLGLSASDQELRYELQHGPMSQMLYPNGEFIGTQGYQNLLANQFNMTVPQFEDLVRKDLTIRKLRALIEGGATVSQQEIQQEFKAQNTKVKFDYAVLSMDDVAKTITPTDAELRAYYEKQKPQLTNSIPEQRNAKYILIDPAKLGAKVTPEDLQSYYKQHQDEYRVPESVTVRHILIKTPAPGPDGKVDQKAVDAAKAKAEDILKQLKSGANFEALAKKFSDDPGSKDNGGSIGQITKGRTVPEFEQAAFSTPKGQLTGPVKTQFGFHIIRVDDKTEAHLKSLDEVKAQIEPVIARQKGTSEAERMAKNVQSAAATQGMEKAAAQFGLQVQTTGMIARANTIPGVGVAPAFMDAMFSQKPPATPQAVATSTGWAVLQATEVKPAATPTFEEAKARLAEQFKREKAQSVLVQKIQELADKAKAEHNLRAAAKAVGATVKTSELVAPGAQVPDIGPLQGPAEVVFTLKPGEISQPVGAGNNGVVFSLLDKQEPSQAEFAQQKDRIRDGLLNRKRAEIVEVYVSSLRDRMQKEGKIKINEKEMKRITTSMNEQQQD